MLRVERSYAFHVSRAKPELTGDQSLMLPGLDGKLSVHLAEREVSGRNWLPERLRSPPMPEAEETLKAA
jgi:hypothetical protein